MLFPKRQDYTPTQTWVLGQTVTFELTREFHIESIYLEVDMVDNAWRTASLNNSGYVKTFDMVRKENGLLTNQCTLIHVPAFNLYFLGRESPGGMEMAYLGEKAINDIPAKRFMLASQIMPQLNAIAKTYNGLPW